MNYYSEFDPYAAEWLRLLMAEGLIPQGYVDERDIKEVTATDLRGYTQHHFFAGIGGWPLALRLAGWPDDRPIVTGSCPCQPYSLAGRQKGNADERDLWPTFATIIRSIRPVTVVGEQVPSAIGHGWLDRIHDDLETEGYEVGAIVLPACSVGAPILRQRLFWLVRARGRGCRAEPVISAGTPNASPIGVQAASESQRCGRDNAVGCSDCDGRSEGGIAATGDGHGRSVGSDGQSCAVECSSCHRRHQRRPESSRGSVASGCGVVPVGGTCGERYQERSRDGRIQPPARHAPQGQTADVSSAWRNYSVVRCRDGKSRRISPERGSFPLAHGIPGRVGPLVAALERMGVDSKSAHTIARRGRELLDKARQNRAGRLKGHGNAIVSQVTAVFLRAVMQIETDWHATTRPFRS